MAKQPLLGGNLATPQLLRFGVDHRTYIRQNAAKAADWFFCMPANE